jgi:hypothetical protein
VPFTSCEHILLLLQLQETLLVVAGDDAASGDAFEVLQALGAAEPVSGALVMVNNMMLIKTGGVEVCVCERERALCLLLPLLLLLVPGNGNCTLSAAERE